jgi:oxaloacetate decarboxylase alpha subunit
MLTNLELQLREQNASDKLDAVLEEIPKVRKDLGTIPLVTPTSQIVGSQAVLNVLSGERYANITRETAGILKGEYGATPAPVNAELQARVLEGGDPITCRPADLLQPELDTLQLELLTLAGGKDIALCAEPIDDVLTYALFQQVGLKFLEHRGDASAFEPAPDGLVDEPVPASGRVASGPQVYTVKVNGRAYAVEVSEGGEVNRVEAATANGKRVDAALAGNIFKIVAPPGSVVAEGDTILVLEAMKMETEVSAPSDGIVDAIHVAEGDAVVVGAPLFTLS